MLYRDVPKNGDTLSVLGYGCMRFPTRMQRIDEAKTKRQILSAIDQGVNYFDTAMPYHNGKSEPFLGKTLAESGIREKVKIATKLAHWAVHSKADMDDALDQQLTRLQTDRIDYYLIHNLTGDSWEIAKQKGIIEFLESARDSGKILNTGFSFHGAADEFPKIVDDYDWTVCQIQYNILDVANQAGLNGLKYAASKDLAVIIMEPLRGGNLAKTPPPSVQKIWNRSPVKRPPVEWALRWIWNHPEVTVVLSGMNQDNHIDQNIAIASTATPDSFSQAECKLVDDVRETFQAVMKVGCTGCQYCMPCPADVDIPRCFEFYNSRHTFKDIMARLFYLTMLGALVPERPRFASQCVKCGKCVEKCPQSIPIPERLEEVKDDMEGILMKPLLWIIQKAMRVKVRKKR